MRVRTPAGEAHGCVMTTRRKARSRMADVLAGALLLDEGAFERRKTLGSLAEHRAKRELGVRAGSMTSGDRIRRAEREKSALKARELRQRRFQIREQEKATAAILKRRAAASRNSACKGVVVDLTGDDVVPSVRVDSSDEDDDEDDDEDEEEEEGDGKGEGEDDTGDSDDMFMEEPPVTKRRVRRKIVETDVDEESEGNQEREEQERERPGEHGSGAGVIDLLSEVEADARDIAHGRAACQSKTLRTKETKKLVSVPISSFAFNPPSDMPKSIGRKSRMQPRSRVREPLEEIRNPTSNKRSSPDGKASQPKRQRGTNRFAKASQPQSLEDPVRAFTNTEQRIGEPHSSKLSARPARVSLPSRAAGGLKSMNIRIPVLKTLTTTIAAAGFYDSGTQSGRTGKVECTEKNRSLSRSNGRGKSAVKTKQNKIQMRSDMSIDIRLRKLSEAEANAAKAIMFKVPKNDVIVNVKVARIVLRGRDFNRLRGCRWLNDELINSFIALINERNALFCKSFSRFAAFKSSANVAADPEDENEVTCVPCAPGAKSTVDMFKRPRPRTHVFNTFFYARLVQQSYDYQGVRRWLKKAGYMKATDLDLILFPINLNNFHWILAAADLRAQQFIYYDSMYHSDSTQVLPNLRRWLHDEIVDKCGQGTADEMGILSWDLVVNPSYLPRQHDDGSCGVFTLYMADFLELGRKPEFEQKDIRVLRQRTALFLQSASIPDS